MSSSFSFNLRNDDIEDDADDDDKPVSTANVRESSKVPAAEPKLHTLGDMVRSPALSWHKIHIVVSGLYYQTPVAKKSALFVMDSVFSKLISKCISPDRSLWQTFAAVRSYIF